MQKSVALPDYRDRCRHRHTEIDGKYLQKSVQEVRRAHLSAVDGERIHGVRVALVFKSAKLKHGNNGAKSAENEEYGVQIPHPCGLDQHLFLGGHTHFVIDRFPIGVAVCPYGCSSNDYGKKAENCGQNPSGFYSVKEILLE